MRGFMSEPGREHLAWGGGCRGSRWRLHTLGEAEPLRAGRAQRTQRGGHIQTPSMADVTFPHFPQWPWPLFLLPSNFPFS